MFVITLLLFIIDSNFSEKLITFSLNKHTNVENLENTFLSFEKPYKT